MKPLILGEAPSLTGEGARPILGRNTDRLSAWSGLPVPEVFDLANLSDVYPGPAGRGAAFLHREAAEKLRQQLLPSLQGRVVVLLGSRLARLFRAGRRHLFVPVDGFLVSWVYHPSGLTLQYNDPTEQELAGVTLRQALELVEEQTR